MIRHRITYAVHIVSCVDLKTTSKEDGGNVYTWSLSSRTEERNWVGRGGKGYLGDQPLSQIFNSVLPPKKGNFSSL